MLLRVRQPVLLQALQQQVQRQQLQQVQLRVQRPLAQRQQLQQLAQLQQRRLKLQRQLQQLPQPPKVLRQLVRLQLPLQLARHLEQQLEDVEDVQTHKKTSVDSFYKIYSIFAHFNTNV